MRIFRRLGLFAVIASALIGAGMLAGRLFPRGPSEGAAPAPRPQVDTASEALWRKGGALPRDTAISAYETLLRPWMGGYGLGPRNVVKHTGYFETLLPRGRPIHEYAFDLEDRCHGAGIRVLEGRELDPPGERLEYRLQAPASPPLTLRLSFGKASLSGASRLALVIAGVDSLGEGEFRRLIAFPFPLTVQVPAVDADPGAARWARLPAGKEILLALPMEPTAYPYVKPGPGALFIHHKRAEVEKLLEAKLRGSPQARGFATAHGDRAIANRPLLQNVLRYAAAKRLVFLDLTGSPSSLAASVAQSAGAVAYMARAQDAGPEEELEAELARRCVSVQKTGEGIWVLRYAPGLLDRLERLLRKNEGRFTELGLEFVTVGALKR